MKYLAIVLLLAVACQGIFEVFFVNYEDAPDRDAASLWFGFKVVALVIAMYSIPWGG